MQTQTKILEPQASEITALGIVYRYGEIRVVDAPAGAIFGLSVSGALELPPEECAALLDVTFNPGTQVPLQDFVQYLADKGYLLRQPTRTAIAYSLSAIGWNWLDTFRQEFQVEPECEEVFQAMREEMTIGRIKTPLVGGGELVSWHTAHTGRPVNEDVLRLLAARRDIFLLDTQYIYPVGIDSYLKRCAGSREDCIIPAE